MPRKKKTPADITEAKRLEKLNEELKSIFTEDIISKQYDKAKKKLDTWERKKFKGQGALGPIPSWFPNNEVIRLSKAREWLAKRWDEEKRKVSERSLKDIMEKMDAFRKHQKTGVPYDEKKYGHETYGPVSRVSFYEDVISAGPVEGLKMMVGGRVAKAISEKNARFERSKEGRAEIQNQKQKRENKILEFLTQLNSSRAGKVSDSQLIRKAADHFAWEDENGFKESSIRRVWNKHFKNI